MTTQPNQDTNMTTSTKKQFVELLCALLQEQEAFNEQMKDLKSKIKDAGLDAAMLTAVAKAINAGKQAELHDKSESIIITLEECGVNTTQMFKNYLAI